MLQENRRDFIRLFPVRKQNGWFPQSERPWETAVRSGSLPSDSSYTRVPGNFRAPYRAPAGDGHGPGNRETLVHA